jgi:hypothetical protein
MGSKNACSLAEPSVAPALVGLQGIFHLFWVQFPAATDALGIELYDAC